MALVTTTLTPAAQVITFDRPPDVQTPYTATPRAAVNFCEQMATTGTGAGDTENLLIELNLPENYYYRPTVITASMPDMSFTPESAWDTMGRVIFETNMETYYANLNVASNRRGTGSTDSYTLVWGSGDLTNDIFSQIIDGRNIAPLSRSPKVTINLGDNDGSINSQEVYVFARFLQYDVADANYTNMWATGNLFS